MLDALLIASNKPQTSEPKMGQVARRSIFVKIQLFTTAKTTTLKSRYISLEFRRIMFESVKNLLVLISS